MRRTQISNLRFMRILLVGCDAKTERGQQERHGRVYTQCCGEKRSSSLQAPLQTRKHKSMGGWGWRVMLTLFLVLFRKEKDLVLHLVQPLGFVKPKRAAISRKCKHNHKWLMQTTNYPWTSLKHVAGYRVFVKYRQVVLCAADLASAVSSGVISPSPSPSSAVGLIIPDERRKEMWRGHKGIEEGETETGRDRD